MHKSTYVMKLMRGWAPRPEIERGEINASLYAADLWRVYEGKAHQRYQDPREFFKRTYFTNALRGILVNAAKRLSGDENANPVIIITTPLGGGKTHTLIALYHLARAGVDTDVAELLKGEGIPAPGLTPLVVVFDGSQLDPKYLSEKYGSRALWYYVLNKICEAGLELACRYATQYKGFDTAPGAQPLAEVLEALEKQNKPLVLLIDEILNYVKNVEVEEREKIALFLHHLARAFTQAKRSLLVITFVTEKEAEELAHKLRQPVQRVSDIKEVTSFEDLPHLVKKALLEDVNNEEAERAAAELASAYEENKNAFAKTYAKEELRRWYPLHPELAKILAELQDWLPKIQKTRDLLRTLAWTIYEMYKRGDGGFITPGDVPVENPDLKPLVLPDQLQSVVEVDLADVKRLEDSGGECSKVVRRIYRALALYSVVGRPLGKNEVTTMVYKPGLGSPQLISPCLENMVGDVYHLHETPEKRYIIKSRAFWKAVVRRKVEEMLKEKEELYGELKNQLQGVLRSARTKTYLWERPPDRPELTIVLADPRRPDWEKYLEVDEKGNPRVYKGALIVLLPDKNAVEELLHKLAELRAVSEVLKEASAYGLDELDKKALEEYKNGLINTIRNKTKELYVQICHYGTSGPVCYNESITLHEEKGRTLREQLIEKLKEYGKVIDRISPDVLRSYLAGLEGGGNPPRFKELVEYFSGRLPDWPLLLEARTALKKAVDESKGMILVVRGGKAHIKLPHIEDDDLIATENYVKARGIPFAEEDIAIPPRVDVVITPQPIAVGETAEIGKIDKQNMRYVDVIEELKRFKDNKIRLNIIHKSDNPMLINRFSSLLKYIIMKDTSVRIKSFSMEFGSERGVHRLKLDAEGCHLVAHVVEKIIPTLTSSFSAKDKDNRIIMKLDVEIFGEAKKLLEEALQLPLFKEPLGNAVFERVIIERVS